MTITGAPQPTIHTSLPSGFAFANQQQAAQYAETGAVNGASKLSLVETADGVTVAVRLGPPKYDRTLTRRAIIREALHGRTGADALDWYKGEYNAGFAAGKSGRDSRKWQDGSASHAWDDGFLDGAAGRPKWHLTHCANHDTCGEG